MYCIVFDDAIFSFSFLFFSFAEAGKPSTILYYKYAKVVCDDRNETDLEIASHGLFICIVIFIFLIFFIFISLAGFL